MRRSPAVVVHAAWYGKSRTERAGRRQESNCARRPMRPARGRLQGSHRVLEDRRRDDAAAEGPANVDAGVWDDRAARRRDRGPALADERGPVVSGAARGACGASSPADATAAHGVRRLARAAVRDVRRDRPALLGEHATDAAISSTRGVRASSPADATAAHGVRRLARAAVRDVRRDRPALLGEHATDGPSALALHANPRAHPGAGKARGGARAARAAAPARRPTAERARLGDACAAGARRLRRDRRSA